MLDIFLYLTFLELETAFLKLETAFLKSNRLLLIAKPNPSAEFMGAFLLKFMVLLNFVGFTNNKYSSVSFIPLKKNTNGRRRSGNFPPKILWHSW